MMLLIQRLMKKEKLIFLNYRIANKKRVWNGRALKS